MIEDIYALTLMDLRLSRTNYKAPFTQWRHLPGYDVKVDPWLPPTGWADDFGMKMHSSNIEMTWISYIDVHHMCLVCRIQRALPLKSNALGLSKWAACPAKVISSQRWHRRVASDCSWQFRGTSNSNCYWLASAKIKLLLISQCQC